MLILARKPGESLLLDGGIRIDVLSSDGRTVRLGIVAPAEVRILRAEIVASVEAETRRAAEAAAAWTAERGAATAAGSGTPLRPIMPLRLAGSRATTAG